MLDASPSFSQLLMDWDARTAASSSGETLFDLLCPLPTDEPSSDEVDDAKQKKQVSRSTLCRQRQRQELLRLRRHVEELESFLKKLQSDRRVRGQGGRMSVWERLAKHQAELRQKAEAENAKLCGLMEEHKKQAAKIEKAIHQRTLEAQTREALTDRSLRPSLVETTVTAGWKTKMESPLWRQIFDRVFNNDDFWMEDLERDEVNFTMDTDGCMVIEHAHSKLYPFDLSRTSRAVWKCYGAEFMEMACGYYSATNATDKVMAAECQVALEIGSKPLVLRSDFLIHQFSEEPNRVVIVWVDWPGNKLESDNTSTVRLALDVCVCMDEVPASINSNMTGPATIARVFSTAKPTYKGSEFNDRILVATDGLVRSYHDSSRRFSQSVESILLDESLQRRAITSAA